MNSSGKAVKDGAFTEAARVCEVLHSTIEAGGGGGGNGIGTVRW